MKKKNLGIAISAGSVRGLSSVGILKVFDRHKIPIDFIAGTSMGSIVGAAYASGMSAKEIEKEITKTNFQKLIDFSLPKKGLIVGNKIEKFLRKLLKDKDFSDLSIPLSVIATDLNKGKMVEFNKGDLTNAVRASISIPGVFHPVEMKDMLLVDGGLTNPIPVDIVRKNARKVIAFYFITKEEPEHKIKESERKRKNKFINSLKKKLITTEVNKIKEYIDMKNIKLPLAFKFFLNPERVTRYIGSFPFATSQILDITLKSFGVTIHEIGKLKLQQTKVDLIIKPNLPNVGVFDFDNPIFCIKQGEKEAKKNLEEIKKLMR